MRPVRVGRRSKFGNTPTVVDGIRFASKKEARRFGELTLLEKAGEIQCLALQPRYQLSVNGEHIGVYVGDFLYYEAGAWVVEDTKGVRTPVYVLKRKLMRAIHGITIKET